MVNWMDLSLLRFVCAEFQSSGKSIASFTSLRRIQFSKANKKSLFFQFIGRDLPLKAMLLGAKELFSYLWLTTPQLKLVLSAQGAKKYPQRLCWPFLVRGLPNKRLFFNGFENRLTSANHLFGNVWCPIAREKDRKKAQAKCKGGLSSFQQVAKSIFNISMRFYSWNQRTANNSASSSVRGRSIAEFNMMLRS